MTFIQIIDTFTFYGIDVLLLAFLTTILTQLFKKTVFCRTQKKVVTFLPFILGTILYAVYVWINGKSFELVLKQYTIILEHGISVGAAATLYYVMYEQFVRKNYDFSTTERVIATLISGYIPNENLQKAAKEIAEAIKMDVVGEGASKAKEILLSYAEGKSQEQDITLLSKLIIETLSHLVK